MRSLLILVLTLTAPSASAQVTLNIRTVDGRTRTEGTVQIRAQGNLLVMDVRPAGEDPSDALSVIFRGDRNEILVMDPSTRTYMVVDGTMKARMTQQLEATGKQFSDQMATVPKSALDRMPPEARAQYEAALESLRNGTAGTVGQGMVAPSPTTRGPLVRSSSTGNAAGVSCRWWERTSGRTTERFCAAAASEFEGGPELKAAMLAMITFYEEAFGSAAATGKKKKSNPMSSSPFFTSRQLLDEGLLPIRTEERDGATILAESEITNSRRGAIPASAFEPPAEFAKRAILGGGSR